MGLVLGIPILIAGVFYAKWIGNKSYQLPDENGIDYIRRSEKVEYPEFLELVNERSKQLPSFTKSILPIFLPVALILLNTTLTSLKLTEGFLWNSRLFRSTNYCCSDRINCINLCTRRASYS